MIPHNSYQEILLNEFESPGAIKGKIDVYPDPNKIIKRGIWLYFLLLVFEGALRKWFLPGLATPLLIIRDPIALWLVFVTWKRGILPFNWVMFTIILITIISFITTLLFGHGNFFVTLYGARIFMIHIPLIFVIGVI